MITSYNDHLDIIQHIIGFCDHYTKLAILSVSSHIRTVGKRIILDCKGTYGIIKNSLSSLIYSHIELDIAKHIDIDFEIINVNTMILLKVYDMDCLKKYDLSLMTLYAVDFSDVKTAITYDIKQALYSQKSLRYIILPAYFNHNENCYDYIVKDFTTLLHISQFYNSIVMVDLHENGYYAGGAGGRDTGYTVIDTIYNIKKQVVSVYGMARIGLVQNKVRFCGPIDRDYLYCDRIISIMLVSPSTHTLNDIPIFANLKTVDISLNTSVVIPIHIHHVTLHCMALETVIDVTLHEHIETATIKQGSNKLYRLIPNNSKPKTVSCHYRTVTQFDLSNTTNITIYDFDILDNYQIFDKILHIDTIVIYISNLRHIIIMDNVVIGQKFLESCALLNNVTIRTSSNNTIRTTIHQSYIMKVFYKHVMIDFPLMCTTENTLMHLRDQCIFSYAYGPVHIESYTTSLFLFENVTIINSCSKTHDCQTHVIALTNVKILRIEIIDESNMFDILIPDTVLTLEIDDTFYGDSVSRTNIVSDIIHKTPLTTTIITNSVHISRELIMSRNIIVIGQFTW